MKNSKKNLIVVILGIVLIISGFICTKIYITDEDTNLNEENDDALTTEETESNSEYDYGYAYNLATSLYGGEGKNIEVTENTDSYTIIITDSDGNTLNTLEMSKEDGTISETPIDIGEIVDSIK